MVFKRTVEQTLRFFLAFAEVKTSFVLQWGPGAGLFSCNLVAAC